jgi:hypothetical protein
VTPDFLVLGDGKIGGLLLAFLTNFAAGQKKAEATEVKK